MVNECKRLVSLVNAVVVDSAFTTLEDPEITQKMRFRYGLLLALGASDHSISAGKQKTDSSGCAAAVPASLVIHCVRNT